jgi:hypothetical protein
MEGYPIAVVHLSNCNCTVPSNDICLILANVLEDRFAVHTFDGILALENFRNFANPTFYMIIK